MTVEVDRDILRLNLASNPVLASFVQVKAVWELDLGDLVVSRHAKKPRLLPVLDDVPVEAGTFEVWRDRRYARLALGRIQSFLGDALQTRGRR